MITNGSEFIPDGVLLVLVDTDAPKLVTPEELRSIMKNLLREGFVSPEEHAAVVRGLRSATHFINLEE